MYIDSVALKPTEVLSSRGSKSLIDSFGSGVEKPAEKNRQRDLKASMSKPKTVTDETTWLNDLILRVSVGKDRIAFRELFQHFAPRIKGFFQGQGSSPDKADEVVQEAMVNVWRKAHLFDPSKAKASTWIFTIARNSRIDLLRKENRPEPDYSDPTFYSVDEPRPDEVFEREDEAQKLKAILDGLPAEQQKVLRLAFFEEKAHVEIAEELNLPLGTVKSRIRLAFKRLRSELGENK
jgi:RNA polymerase sigma-70 factor (ECF subfamily)